MRARAIKYKLGVRANKYKLRDKAVKYNLMAMAGKCKLGVRDRSQGQSKWPCKGPVARKYKYPKTLVNTKDDLVLHLVLLAAVVKSMIL